jgi:DNA-directed RNA polymerase subunit M/transcription elongation factor TFIIS
MFRAEKFRAMNFCDVCHNMLYLREEPDRALQYWCKHCGNTLDASQTDSKWRVLDTNYVDDHTQYQQYVNENIEEDTTLPRVDYIACPNKDCTSNAAGGAGGGGGAGREVIMVRIDADALKWLYYCTHCKRFWKGES